MNFIIEQSHVEWQIPWTLDTALYPSAEHPKPHIPGSIPDTPAGPPVPVDDPDPVDTPDEQPRDD